jgi:hypothetical protein
MALIRVILLLALQISSTSQAQSVGKQIINRLGGEATGHASGWYQEFPNVETQANLKARLRLDGWVNVTSDGCLKVKARIATGNTLNNEWMNTGLGTQPTDLMGDLSLGLRQLYISSECRTLGRVKLTSEAGAVAVRSFGSMGLYANQAHMDGLQIYLQDEKSGTEWIASVGRVTPEAHLLDRGQYTVNHFTVLGQKSFLKNGKAFVAFAQYENNKISRAGLQWALDQYAKWLQLVTAESIVINQRYSGTMLSLTTPIKKTSVRWVASSINPNPTEQAMQSFQMKQFYGYGKNLLIEVTRPLQKGFTLTLRARVGDAGDLAIIGISKNLKTKNKSK